jgi:hypothetical protein
LKPFVVADDPDSVLVPSAGADYGFFNCRNEEKKVKLKEVYKKVFEDSNGDPLKLHEACPSL